MNKIIITLIIGMFLIGFVSPADESSILYGQNETGALNVLRTTNDNILMTDINLLNITAGDAEILNNVTAGGWFNGLFNWVTLTNWLIFDGSTLSFNETKLNLTIDARASGLGNNSSWNESLANTLYAGIEWNYNQSDGSYNATYDTWGYNQTTPANTYTDEVNTSQSSWINTIFLKIADMFTMENIVNMISGNLTEAKDYTDGIVTDNNASWTSTYNSTYADSSGDNESWNESLANTLYSDIKWGYNQTYSGSTYNETYDALQSGNATFNQTLTDGLYANIKWGYNQTYSGSTYNATYDAATGDNASWNQSFANTLYSDIEWNYNQSDGSYNATYDLWSYNQTYSGSTYNATYDANSGNATFNQSLTDTLYSDIEWNYNQSDGSYNATYDEFAYNQTISANTYTDEVNASQSNWINTIFIKIADMFTMENIVNMISGNLTEANDYTDGIVTDNNESWTSTYNSTYASATGGNGDNASWNETLAREIFVPYTGATDNLTSTFDVIANKFYGLFDWFIGSSSLPYLSFNGSTLEFNETKLNLTISLIASESGGNASWNESLANTLYDPIGSGNTSWNEALANALYAPNTTSGIQYLLNDTGVYSTYNLTYANKMDYNATTNLNMSNNNITNIDRTCYGDDCKGQIYYNGSRLIIRVLP